ncbi:MAG TPA: hypothetical protein H9891_00700 [Candidatus Salinicoccus stercoripullorum]|uniref:Uncharacterized protein n=1 Tax=Candidatus Salinicoccus stercoripullorum TaxID=2838756 RepID=A0A9D1TZ16_9STAP|nr:hypothetical protein [Candidatus Salinicoccus stercoripullorum]
MPENTGNLNRNLIITLAMVALIRPLMSIIGISEIVGKPVASITSTIVISIIWIAAVTIKNETRPVITLMMTGIAYAITAMILSGILSPILTGTLQGPLTNSFAIISMLMTNIVWGFVTGIAAAFLLKMKKTQSD